LGKTSGVIRLKVPENITIVVIDGIRGEISFESNTIDDQVLMKSDGFPTYHLAVVVDDHLMEITDVVRGEEWLTSSPKHWLLYEFFGWEKPNFYHTPVLRNPDKSKLSKRHGHTSVEWYKEAGFLPEAILNFLALMGWSHPEEKEIFSLSEFIELFNLKDLKPVAPIFDLNKLTWMNGMYIRELETEDLVNRLVAFDPSLSRLPEIVLTKFSEIAKSRIKTLKEFKILIDPFLNKRTFEITPEQKELRVTLSTQLMNISDWNKDTLVEALKSFAEQNGINFKEYYRMLFNEKAGLPLADAFETIGKEKTLELIS
jgi:glutamyl-tRNA synthetase